MQTIVSPQVIAPQPGTKSNCKVYNGQIFVSGMTGRDLDNSIPEGMYAQSKLLFGKMKALVEAAGGKMDDLIQINVFVTEMSTLEEFWRARREFFTGDFPCSTLVQVAGLANPALKVEVNATGFIGAAGS
jgi:enamine deaminase RidA (YjgF/YER057c/UK114 family)